MTQDRVFLLITVLLVLIVFLAAPALIALVRKHPDRRLISKLTPLTLFSFILWVALLVWAASDKRDDAIISKYVMQLRGSWRFPFAIGLLVTIGAIGTVATMLQWG